MFCLYLTLFYDLPKIDWFGKTKPYQNMCCNNNHTINMFAVTINRDDETLTNLAKVFGMQIKVSFQNVSLSQLNLLTGRA